MGSAGIVETVDVAPQRGPGLRDAGVGPQIDLLVFDRVPEPFHDPEGIARSVVVPPGALAIHADGNLMGFQQVREGHGCELRALIPSEGLARDYLQSCARGGLNLMRF